MHQSVWMTWISTLYLVSLTHAVPLQLFQLDTLQASGIRVCVVSGSSGNYHMRARMPLLSALFCRKVHEGFSPLVPFSVHHLKAVLNYS